MKESGRSQLDVSSNIRSVAADCGNGIVQFLLTATGNEDVGALAGEQLRRSQPDSLCTAGDDGHFSL